MVKKKIDSRVRGMIENAAATNQRAIFVLVGDRGREQVVNLHYMLSKAAVKARPSVLWCYKKELGFTTHRRKRMKEVKKKMKQGLIDPDKDDPFELFLSATTIRWCYYAETHKILGNTFGMCVLQDFEALTPNLLARTIETVEGGGLIIVLLRSVTSVQQLYTMAMDVHDRFRTEAHQDVVGRFNERFLLSLQDISSCLLLDDTLDVLPWAHPQEALAAPAAAQKDSNAEELRELVASLADSQPVGTLVSCCKTLDQAKALLTFVEAISEKTLRSTVALTAARGRGKSAALGLAMAAAVAYGYSNIFVTSPSPENLKTLFEFIFKGFDALNYKEHTDYELIQSSNPDFNGAIVRVNIFQGDHRQTIQYIQPQDAAKLAQAELVVIDEAAAIPLPLVKSLLGPYLVFMASTINGYEGTGRSLSLKLLQQLRHQSAPIAGAAAAPAAAEAASASARVLRTITLETPIRYSAGDPIEAWLNSLLCLDATVLPRGAAGCPHPSACDLYHVDRDALFSYNKLSELFLQRLVAIYVSSHYKNTPNDLQLLSDAPAHRVFVLLGPIDKSGTLPEILCVVQVALEGEISQETVKASLGRGVRAAGDLIPWTLSQQFLDNDFPTLSGARVVRIATHPDYQNMGYGLRALQQLKAYYEGKITSLDERPAAPAAPKRKEATELKPRTDLPPLLRKLSEVAPERLDWLGVSFGVTPELLRFWKKAHFTPIYVRQTANELTGEHTCIMLHPMASSRAPPGWLDTYWTDFQHRFVSLLGFAFKSFPPALGLSALERTGADADAGAATEAGEHSAGAGAGAQSEGADRDLLQVFTAFDLKRLHAYARSQIDFHVVMDLVPQLARLWFLGKLRTSLSAVQKAILLGMGLQFKSVEDLEIEFGIRAQQVMALFGQTMRKFSKIFLDLQEEKAEATMPASKRVSLQPLAQSLAAAQSSAKPVVMRSHADEEGESDEEDENEAGSDGAEEESEAARAMEGTDDDDDDDDVDAESEGEEAKKEKKGTKGKSAKGAEAEELDEDELAARRQEAVRQFGHFAILEDDDAFEQAVSRSGVPSAVSLKRTKPRKEFVKKEKKSGDGKKSKGGRSDKHSGGRSGSAKRKHGGDH